MTHLILVRHGETIWHTENRYAGSSDIPLSSQGQRDAAMLAQWAATKHLEALWVSPLSRTRATAEPVSQVTGLAPIIDERLRELDFGAGEGCTKHEMQQTIPSAYQNFSANPIEHHLPGGEDPRNAVQRALACFHDIQRHYPDGRVLIVMHNTLLRLALCQLLTIPLEKYRQVFPAIHNCSLTELQWDGGQAALLSFNVPIGEEVSS